VIEKFENDEAYRYGMYAIDTCDTCHKAAKAEIFFVVTKGLFSKSPTHVLATLYNKNRDSN
jgi:hypothetical protein